MYAGQPVVTGPFFGVGGNNAVNGMARWDGTTWGPVGPPGQIGNSSAGLGLFDGALVAASGETANLASLYGTSAIYLNQVEEK